MSRNKQYLVCEAHEVIDSSHYLTESELKLIQLCLAGIYQAEPVEPDTFYTIDKKTYSDLFNLTEEAAYQALVEASSLLMTRTITLKSTLLDPAQPKNSKTIINWVEACRYNGATSQVELKWGKDILYLLSQFNTDLPYSKYFLSDTCGLTNVHAIRLYRLANKWALAGTKTFEIAEFRRLLGFLEGEYQLFKNLNQKVIKPSVEAINLYTNLKLSYTLQSVGRNVAKITFKIKK
jgi:plasmid replication initiation protein